jgi:hypothetical protein
MMLPKNQKLSWVSCRYGSHPCKCSKAGVEIQNSVSISLKREICEHMETLQISFESYFRLDGINVELPDLNCIEDVDLSKEELIDLRTETYYK